MKKRILLVLSFVLICLLVLGSGIASADTPGNGTGWITGFFVTNKTSDLATVNMSFYKENTATATYTVDKTIDANDTVFYFLPGNADFDGNALPNGEYSLVLSSNADINAVANSTSTGGSLSSSDINSTTSYDGVGDSGAASKLFAPNIYSDYFGFTTNFYLQNASGASTTVNIKYFNAQGQEIASLAENNVNIPDGSFIKRDQKGVTGLTQNQVGSATFECTTSNCRLVGVVNITAGSGIGTANYVTYSTGSQVAYAPVVLNDYFDFNSSINIQNNGTAGAIDVEIEFSDGTKVKVTDTTNDGKGTTLGEGQAWSVFLPNVNGLSEGDANGDLAATVSILTPEAGDSIVVLANTSRSVDKAFASYNGVIGGASKVYGPASNALAFGAFKFFTSVTCQNLTNTSTDLRYTFNGVNTNAGNSTVSGVNGLMSAISGAPSTLGEGESYVLLLNLTSVQSALGLNPSGGFNGSTTVEAVASGAEISCVVNQNRAVSGLPGDNLGSYTSRP